MKMKKYLVLITYPHFHQWRQLRSLSNFHLKNLIRKGQYMHFKLPYYATLIIPGLLYGIFTSSIMGGFIVVIVQFVLAPIIFREWFTFKVWDDYQRTGDEDENPFVKQGLANVIVSIFVMIAVSVLKSKGYI